LRNSVAFKPRTHQITLWFPPQRAMLQMQQKHNDRRVAGRCEGLAGPRLRGVAECLPRRYFTTRATEPWKPTV
jgi:hypothetical protein